MRGYDIITIGAAAGLVEALGSLVGGLPADLPASVFVTLHVPSHGASSLPQILSKRGPLPFEHARDGAALADWTASRFDSQARKARERAAVIRQLLVQSDLNAESTREPDQEGGTG